MESIKPIRRTSFTQKITTKGVKKLSDNRLR